MRVTLQHRWLVVTVCLLITACTTEKTYIQEVPADTTTDAATEPDAVVGDVVVGDAVTVSNGLTTQSDPEVESTVSQTPAQATVEANMVDASQVTVATNVADTSQADVASNMVDASQATGSLTSVAETPATGGTPTIATTDTELLSDPLNAGSAAGTVTAIDGAGITSDTTTDITTAAITDAATDETTDTATAATTGTATDATTGTTTVATTDATTGAPIDATTGTSTDVTTGATTATDTDAVFLSDPTVPTVIGTPGMSVDCDLTLPCRWVSDDAQFAVTVTNADNIGLQGRLSIEYSIVTAHDTQVLIASTEPALDANGLSYVPSALVLGEGIGGRAQGVTAGAEVAARIEFNSSSTASSLSLWTIALNDGGLIRQPSFSNIPVGSATTQHADCALTLPCAWVSPDANATITLLSVTGTGTTNRLSASFKVETTRNTVVAVDSGSTAVGTDGLPYRGRTHSLSLQTGSEKLTANSIPGAQVAGTVYFFVTQSMSAALQNLSLIIYEDQPVPRWNPSFLSVPVQ